MGDYGRFQHLVTQLGEYASLQSPQTTLTLEGQSRLVRPHFRKHSTSVEKRPRGRSQLVRPHFWKYFTSVENVCACVKQAAALILRPNWHSRMRALGLGVAHAHPRNHCTKACEALNTHTPLSNSPTYGHVDRENIRSTQRPQKGPCGRSLVFP